MEFYTGSEPSTKNRRFSRIASLLVAAMMLAAFACTGCTATVSEPEAQEEAVAVAAGYPAEYRTQYKDTWEINNDFKGYLTLEGTQLGVPVVQTVDNEFYKTHGFDKQEGGAAAHLDSRIDLSSAASNVVVYAPDTAATNVFSELVNYKFLDYYMQHPIITFNSVYRDGTYKIFSVLLAEETASQPLYTELINPSSADIARIVLNEVRAASLLQTTVDVQPGDSLLVVRTHDYTLLDSTGKPAELVILGRKVRDGESSAVMMQDVSINPNPALPQAWMEQVVYQQQTNSVNSEIRAEAAEWFTAYELEMIDDADLDRLLTERKELFGQHLTLAEAELPAEEKIYLYETRANGAAAAAALELDKVHLNIKTKEEAVLTATLTPEDAAATYEWKSSDSDILTVSGKGSSATVKAKKAGKATVTVTVGELQAECDVEIKKSSSSSSSSSSASISVNAKSLTLTEGSKSVLTASSKVKEGKTSDSKVATCSVDGTSVTITAKKAGTATITIVGSNGAKTTCKVTVQKAGISLSASSITMTRGDRATIKVTSGTAANWYANNSKAVRVYITDNGKSAIIEAIGSGNAVVTVTDKYGAQASCNVSVREGYISVSPSDFNMTLGDSRTINVTNGYASSWTCNNSSVIRFLSFNGGRSANVQAVGVGNATLTITGEDGSKTYCYISVSKRPASVSISPTSMTVSVDEIRNINVTGGSASNWYSSNENVARIYPVGNGSMAQVEGISSGSATITVVGSNGETTKCSVTVRASEPNVKISPSSMQLTAGDTGNIKVTAGSASNWYSSDPSVAEVFVLGDGSMAQVVAQSSGTATITVVGANNSKSTCVVTVSTPAPKESSLALDKSSMTIDQGETKSIRVISGSAANWYASENGIVEMYVIGDGSVVDIRGIRAGSVTVYAADANGKKTSCSVTVRGIEPTPEPTIAPTPYNPPVVEPEYNPPAVEPEYNPPAAESEGGSGGEVTDWGEAVG